MAKLHTLTVPDFLWVNLQVTKGSQQYSYARLEEAVFTQYGYGESADVLKQAAKLLTEFRRLRPFTHGNGACAFIGMAVFLEMNGFSLTVSPDMAAAWAAEAWNDSSRAEEFIAGNTHSHEESHHDGVPETLEIAEEVLAKYRHAAATLVETEPQTVLL